MYLETQVPIELVILPRADSEADLHPPSLKGKFMTFSSGPTVNIHYVAYITTWVKCYGREHVHQAKHVTLKHL